LQAPAPYVLGSGVRQNLRNFLGSVVNEYELVVVPRGR
jgi:hypothetical protein